ncbi:hypothetical protein RJJ65_05600 [Rhizobium hidalgonense]|uniref:Uncharacterized protein n=1 Tax=Rhizobium hidalgonense TaxID=1538159 RepID=A0AAJ2GTT1_9HYPH|nr:hypothetical protein [Rhizobium hidalgonense]MDR9772136.1 hypothetical protein [Rhizobium hidalgonense]MDR9810195.1 hypothetical protein [Rhizobium hidalgonense]MDR9817796.1 hypothetical protein [Rhizobium hidalgonense]
MIAFPAGMRVWIAGGVTGQERLGLILIATRSFAFAVEDDLINVLSFNGVGRALHVSDWKQANSSGPVSQSGSAVRKSSALDYGRNRLTQSLLHAPTFQGRLTTLMFFCLLWILPAALALSHAMLQSGDCRISRLGCGAGSTFRCCGGQSCTTAPS